MVDLPEVPPGVSENLVEIEGNVFREVKLGRKKVLVPVKVKVGLNPLNVATAGLMALAGALGATIAWHGMSLPVPTGGAITFFKGIKETSFGADLNAAYERFKARNAVEALTGTELVEAIIEGQDVAPGPFCDQARQTYGRLLSMQRATDAALVLAEAQKRTCQWVNEL